MPRIGLSSNRDLRRRLILSLINKHAARPGKRGALLKATPESFVVQANSLARGRLDNSPSVHGMRLLAVAISKVDRGADLLNQVTISPAELRDIFPAYAKNRGLGHYLNEAADQIMSLRGEAYLGPDNWRKINLVSSADYDGKRHGLRIEFHPDMKEFLLALTGSYTRYQLRSIANLSTGYQHSLYQFLRSFVHQRGLQVSLHDLRGRLGVKDSEYKATADLMKRVIKPSLDEINRSTDIEVRFKPITQGRTYIGLEFRLNLKEGQAPSHFTTAVIGLLVEMGVDQRAATNLGADLPLTEILQAIAYAQHQSNRSIDSGRDPISNRGAYIATCLRQRVPPPKDDKQYLACLARIEDQYRMKVFDQLKASDKDALRDGFSRKLDGRLKIDWKRFQGPETAELQQAFMTYLRAVIAPDAPNAVMTIRA